jgi:regulator of cell morphogenesis and NO signaling
MQATANDGTTVITGGMTVNEVSNRFPQTLPVFHAAGIDSCCGGAKPIAKVAESHGLDLDALLRLLNETAGLPEQR